MTLARLGHIVVRMNPTPARPFGEQVAARIEQQGKSLRSVAEAAGIPWSTFQRRVRSQSMSFTLGELTSVAEVLGITPSELITDVAA